MIESRTNKPKAVTVPLLCDPLCTTNSVHCHPHYLLLSCNSIQCHLSKLSLLTPSYKEPGYLSIVNRLRSGRPGLDFRTE